ncbi:MAG: O-antigen ligase family protein [Chloroflexota bacterium]
MELAQNALLYVLIIVVTARFYSILWLSSHQPSLLEEMRAAVLFLGDYVLIPICVLSILRLMVDADYRAFLLASILKIIDVGGAGWFALVVWMGLGALWAGDPTLVRYGTLHLSAEIFMAVVLAVSIRKNGLQSASWAILIGTTGQGLLAVAQSIHQGPLGLPLLNESPLLLFSYYRSFGLTINPNNLAGYLVAGFFVSLILIQQRINRHASVILPFVCSLIILCGLLATQSRAAIIGAVVGLTFIGLINLRRLRTFNRRALLILAVAALVVGVWGSVLFIGNFRDRFLALDQREFWFDDTFAILKESPFIGVGVHNLMLTIGAQHPNDPPTFLRLPVHDAYLMMWAEIGIPGLLLFLSTYLLLIYRSWRSGNASTTILGGCFIAIAVIMLFDFYFWNDHRSRTLLLWMAGLWWGIFLSERNQSPDQTVNLHSPL